MGRLTRVETKVLSPTDLPAPFEPDGDHVAISLPGARVVFTTRRGGHSTGPYTSLNLGRLTDDDPAAVLANTRTVRDAYGVALAWGRQVHGAHVVMHDEQPAAAAGDSDDPSPSPEEGDGRITARPGIAPMVLTADCLAIGVAGGGAVAMLHAGWRGLSDGVIEAGIGKLGELGANPSELEAAIGPHARGCCYEVGEEVHEVFAAAGHDARVGARNLDMARIAREQLNRAGVSRVHDLGMCTMCSHRSLWFSHRRDHGVTGRQAGLAWLT
jgi:YfiH family protein